MERGEGAPSVLGFWKLRTLWGALKGLAVVSGLNNDEERQPLQGRGAEPQVPKRWAHRAPNRSQGAICGGTPAVETFEQLTSP